MLTVKEEKRRKRLKNLEKQRLIRRHTLLDIPFPSKSKVVNRKKNFLMIVRNPKFKKCRFGRKYRNYVFMEGDKRALKDMKRNYGANLVHYEERAKMFGEYEEIEELADDLEGYRRYIDTDTFRYGEHQQAG